jgi:hypothetical protein
MVRVASLMWSNPSRSSRCGHDSANPCRACGPIPDDGEAAGRAAKQQHLPFCVGQLLGLVHHDVREPAGQPVRGDAGQCAFVNDGVLEVFAAQHRHQAYAVLVVGDLGEVVHDPGHVLAFGGHRGITTTLAAGRVRVPEPLPRRVQQRQIGHRPGLGVMAPQRLNVIAAEPGRAPAQVGGHRPQICDEVGRFEQWPRAVEGREQIPVLHE